MRLFGNDIISTVIYMGCIGINGTKTTKRNARYAGLQKNISTIMMQVFQSDALHSIQLDLKEK